MTTTSQNLSLGVLAALGAGLLWGMVFVAPVLLPDYPPLLLTFGRYLAFGIVTVPIAIALRKRLAMLSRQDWFAAFKLSLIGNVAYYLALSAAIQLAGAPLPTLIIGTLPVVIAVCSNLLNARLNQSAPASAAHTFKWSSLAPSLIAIITGLLLVNADQFSRLTQSGDKTLMQYLAGAALAWLAVAAWTWYPIQNARWLQAHPQHSSTIWATAQGMATLPLAIVGFIAAIVYYRNTGDARFAQDWLGPRPVFYVALMFTIGFGASWVGTLLWNIASKNTPTALTGQLIVFETLSALGLAYLIYKRWPSALEAGGIVLLTIGVLLGVRAMARKS
jgi:drug/metabolite transporter (DMT)-like permease